MNARLSTHRVHGFHCDLYGHVNNARYLEFLEAARWETLGAYVDIEDWHAKGWLFVVVNIDIAYRAPARMGDELRIETWRGEMRRASALIQQRVERTSDGAHVADATITYVILNEKTQKPLPMRDEVAAGLMAMPACHSEAQEKS